MSYHYGIDGITKDRTESLRLFRLAADHGHGGAKAMLCNVSPESISADYCKSADRTLPGLAREFPMIPIKLSSGREIKLEAMVVRPDKPGRFPLVILVHGTNPTAGKDFRQVYARQSPAAFTNVAAAFAAHGYAAVAIMRRGFGHSEGQFAEGVHRSCDNQDYLVAGRSAGEDVTGAIATLRHEAWTDPDRVLLLGVSTGGVAVTAAAAKNPAGVVGILNVAGGFRSDLPCGPDHLVKEFGIFARTARIPALWIYAENDRYFAPRHVKSWHAAFRSQGGRGELVLVPPFGEDGHLLFTRGMTVWHPIVGGFLREVVPTAGSAQ